MTIFGAFLIAFLVSLFIGSMKVTIGLGCVVAVMMFSMFCDSMGWLD